jgi:uncharacterized OB-fold protein
VYSFVTLRRSFMAGFDLPLIVALIEMEDCPSVRLVTNIKGVTSEAVRIGQTVEIFAEEVERDIRLPFARPSLAPSKISHTHATLKETEG